MAKDFLKESKLKLPALLDGIDDAAATAYASLPDRMYLVGRDGKIAYAGGKGPRGFKPDELAAAIEKEVTTMESKPDVNALSASERKAAELKLMRTLDADGDGVLSKEEIGGAARALDTLDKNKDGQIEIGEILSNSK